MPDWNQFMKDAMWNRWRLQHCVQQAIRDLGTRLVLTANLRQPRITWAESLDEE